MKAYVSPNVVPSHIDGWSQIRTSFYNELLANQGELLEIRKATLPIVEAEATLQHALNKIELWAQLHELANKIEAAIAKAEGKVTP